MPVAGHGHRTAHTHGAARWRGHRRRTGDRGYARSVEREPMSGGQSTGQGGGGGSGETHQGSVAPVGRRVRVAMVALKVAVELRLTLSAVERPWSTNVTGKR
jgi:hypothetical protein